MSLPKRKQKDESAERRWRSPAHTGWMTKKFVCAMCGSSTNISAAHVRKGGFGGMGLKPDDYRTVPLCSGPYANSAGGEGCHDRQHIIGEVTFWSEYQDRHGQSVEELLASLCKASPKKSEIERHKKAQNIGGRGYA